MTDQCLDRHSEHVVHLASIEYVTADCFVYGRSGSDMYRRKQAASVFLFPALMTVGHMLLACTSNLVITPARQMEWKLLVLIGSAHLIVNSHDQFTDMHPLERPPKHLQLTWILLLLTVNGFIGFSCGIKVVTRLYSVFTVGVLWNLPCLPVISAKKGIIFRRPKELCGPFKSLVVALCAGIVDTEVVVCYACNVQGRACPSFNKRLRLFCFAVLYNWYRETVYDIRDVAEDAANGLVTLPIVLGKRNGFAAACMVTFLGDVVISGNVGVWNVSRVATVVIMGIFTVARPRHEHFRWALFAIVGLVPACLGELALILKY